MKKKVVVFGSFVVDLMGRTEYLPKKGETVIGSMFKIGAGGKGFNQCVAAHKSGADVIMITKIGNDEFSKIAIDTMNELKMDTSFILKSENLHTGCALILVEEATSQNEIVVIPGACGNITDDDILNVSGAIKSADFLLTQLETNIEATKKVIKIAFDENIKVILNPAPAQDISDDILSMVHTITPNETEAEKITGISIDSYDNMQKSAEFFLNKGVKNVIITLGSQGSFVHDGVRCGIVPATKVHAIDTTGAGDAFNGGFVTALSECNDIWNAVTFASSLSGLSVQKIGTTPSMPTRKEIDDFMHELCISKE